MLGVDVSPWHATLGPRKKAIFLSPALAHIVPIKSSKSTSSVPVQPSLPPPTAPILRNGHLPQPVRKATWNGQIHMTRSNNKRMTFAAMLMHGDLLGVEIVLKSMANDPNGVLNISHRIPFEEIAKSERTIMSVLGLAAPTRAEYETRMVDDYCTYFRQKMRAGSVKLDETHSLYIVPPLENPTEGPNAHLYALSPDVMHNTLLAVVCKLNTPARVKNEPEVTQDMIVDLFSNPELIAILNAK